MASPAGLICGAGPVGNHNVNPPNKLFWIFERTGTWQGQSLDSWFVFFDPDRTGSRVKGSVSFDGKILFVQDDPSELQATAAFGTPGVACDLSQVSIGLEAINKAHTTYASDTMTLSWVAAAPGDHIRVMTVAAVAEPTICALRAGAVFAVGLRAVGRIARRRQPA